MTNPCVKGSRHWKLWEKLHAGKILTTKDIVYKMGICNHTKAISNLRRFARRQGGDVRSIQDQVNKNWWAYLMILPTR